MSYVEYHDLLIVMLNVIMLSVVMLSVVMLSVVMLSVVVPRPKNGRKKFFRMPSLESF